MILLVKSTNQYQFYTTSYKKTEETGIFSNRFYETGIILILKSKTVQIKRAIDQYPIL